MFKAWPGNPPLKIQNGALKFYIPDFRNLPFRQQLFATIFLIVKDVIFRLGFQFSPGLFNSPKTLFALQILAGAVNVFTAH